MRHSYGAQHQHMAVPRNSLKPPRPGPLSATVLCHSGSSFSGARTRHSNEHYRRAASHPPALCPASPVPATASLRHTTRPIPETPPPNLDHRFFPRLFPSTSLGPAPPISPRPDLSLSPNHSPTGPRQLSPPGLHSSLSNHFSSNSPPQFPAQSLTLFPSTTFLEHDCNRPVASTRRPFAGH